MTIKHGFEPPVSLDVNEIDLCVPMSDWKPTWTALDQHGCPLGLVIDDHCLVVLYQLSNGQWKPTTHWSKKALDFARGLDLTEL